MVGLEALAAVGLGAREHKAAALLELGMGGLAAMGQAAALLEPRTRKLVATALVCGPRTRARGLTAAALLELRAMGQAAAAAGPRAWGLKGMGLWAAALEVVAAAVGPYPLALASELQLGLSVSSS